MILLKKTETPSKCIKLALRRRRNYKRAIEGLLEKFKETTKSGREISEVSPQTRAQSKRSPKNISASLELECSTSSKIRLLRSCQTVHIKQRGTRFQTADLSLPKQLNQPKSRSAILLGNTQRTPKDRKIKCQRLEAKVQWIKR
jgi:hypothetical protein